MKAVLWIARIISGVIVLSTMYMIAAYILDPAGSGNPPTPKEWFELSLFPFGVCVAYVIAWRWHLLGGVLSLACLMAFSLLMWDRDLILVVSIVGTPAVLYIIYEIYRRRKLSERHTA
jgi:hypothetical protein